MDTLEYLLNECGKALRNVGPAEREHLSGLITSAKRIFIFGVGRSGLIAQTFAVRLVQLGFRVNFIGDMTTPIIAKGDLIILVSNTGSTMSIVKTAEIAKRIGSHVYSVTSERDSDLAANSDDVLLIGSRRGKTTAAEAPLGTVFEGATFLFFDSMVPELMKKLGATEEDMRNRHAIWV